MDYAYKTDSAVIELLKFKIRFSETDKTYMLNNTWVNEVDEHYYSEKIINIKRLLHKQLKNGLKQAEYLQNLMDLIWKKIEHIQSYNCHSPEFLELYSKKISTVNSHHTDPSSNSEQFEKYKSNPEPSSESEVDLFISLNSYSKKMNNFQTLLDFEKGLLLYAVNTHRQILIGLHGFIDSIHMNAEYIDFNNLDFEEFEESIIKKKKDEICHINLDKKSVAHLFRILLEEDFLVFDETNEANNKLEMKRFVEDNFTYQNTRKERTPIETFNREYSEVSSVSTPEVKKHKAFIDNLILTLQARKNSLKD